MIRRLSGENQVADYAALMVAVFFLGRIQLVVLGILGSYLWRILEEVRSRPLYVARRRHGFTHDALPFISPFNTSSFVDINTTMVTYEPARQ